MEHIANLSCQEGIEALENSLSSLTLHRSLLREAPITALCDMLQALRQADFRRAASHYHKMTAALITCGARRVSGSLWQDFLLNAMLIAPTPFSAMAAAGENDEAIYAAMREDLSSLQMLFELDTETVQRLFEERIRTARIKPRANRDSIARMSSAAWSGSQPRRSVPEEAGEDDGLIPASGFSDNFSQWRYGAFSLRDSFVADEALEEMYMRLLQQDAWRALTDDLWNFFASYGCGMFLRHRLFSFNGDKIEPLPELVPQDDAFERLYPDAHGKLIENTIAFMRGEKRENLLLFGGPGCGKTSAMLQLLQELPEVRIVIVTQNSEKILKNLLTPLSRQPLKFILLFDGVSPTSSEMRALHRMLLAMRAVPENIILYATAEVDGDALFPCRIHLPYPEIAELTTLLAGLLEDAGETADMNLIKNACVDYRVETKAPLSLAAAQVILNRLRP